MKQLTYLLALVAVLASCTRPLVSNAQTLPKTPEYSPAMEEAMKEVVITLDSTEIHQRKGSFYYSRLDLFQKGTLTEEDKREKLMHGNYLIYVPEPREPLGSLSYRYHILSHFVAGYPEGVWEYYTNANKLFKRETYRHGKRQQVEHIP